MISTEDAENIENIESSDGKRLEHRSSIDNYRSFAKTKSTNETVDVQHLKAPN
jgi:hypothetical protein